MRRSIVLVCAFALIATACGADEPASDVPDQGDTIEIIMTDMAFTPTMLDVVAGDTVTIRFRNDGTVRHEAVFGDLTEQLAHHEEMTETSGAEHDMESMEMSEGSAGHDGDMDIVVVEPGQTIEVTHVFGQAGETMVGCHEPGHWEAGMKLAVNVV